MVVVATCAFVNSAYHKSDRRFKHDVVRNIAKSGTNDVDPDFNFNEKERISDLDTLRNLKRNAHIERPFSDLQDSVEEDLKNVELLNVK